MIFKANLHEAVRSLYSAKQRTLLALIGIVIGIGSVIAMVSVGNIVQQEALRQFKELGTDILTIEKDFGGGADGKAATANFRLKDVMALPLHSSAISVVAPYTQGGGGDVFYGGKRIERTHFLGVTESFLSLNKLPLFEGRFLSDMDWQSRYIVLGADVADQLRAAGADKVVGEQLRIGEHIFTVLGVLAPVPQSGARRFEPNALVIAHINPVLRLPGTEIFVISAKVKQDAENRTGSQQVVAYFSRLPQSMAVRVSSPEDLIAQMEKQSQMFTLLLGAIGGISLVVGGVGVMNVMLVSVSERRREIGIRRALGAKRGDIRQQFLIESVILSLIGGLLGVFMGIGSSWVISHFAQWQYELSLGAILLGVGVSSVIGVFFGFYPARQASQLDPIIALRSD